jgi:hypothetical protein
VNWTDGRHPLYVGAVMGLAVRQGLDVSAEVDDEGDYTDRFLVRFGEKVTVTLVVPPPPEGWTLDSWMGQGN